MERLRHEARWTQLDQTGDGYAAYAEYAGNTQEDWRNGRQVLVFLVNEVFWQLVLTYTFNGAADYALRANAAKHLGRDDWRLPRFNKMSRVASLPSRLLAELNVLYENRDKGALSLVLAALTTGIA